MKDKYSMCGRLSQALNQCGLSQTDMPQKTDDAGFLTVSEQISIEAQQLANRHQGPSSLIECLQAIGLDLFLPLAAERHYHATVEQLEESSRLESVRRSPVVMIGTKHLFAAPVGQMDEQALLDFDTRILIMLLRYKVKKVTIDISGLDAPGQVAEHWIYGLKKELKLKKISVKIETGLLQ